MRLFVFHNLTLPLIAWLAVGAVLAAQETAPPAGEGKGASEKPTIRVLEPDTYILKDEEGNLQKVLNFSYQAFVEARQVLQGIEGHREQPSYSIQDLQITGKEQGDHVALRLKISILLRGTEWVRVPLGMHDAVLRDVAQYQGEGEFYLHFEPKAGGYVAWLRTITSTEDEPVEEPSEQDQTVRSSTHRLTLQILVPIVPQGEEQTIAVNLPRAVRSGFNIEVQMADASARVSDGATLEPVGKSNSQTTQLTGLGAGGQFELAWHPAKKSGTRLPTALEANGEIFIEVNGPHIESQATLHVRSFGGEFDRFLVRLPPGASLVKRNPTGYIVSPIEDAAADPEARSRGLLVEVKLDKKVKEAPPIQLMTEQSVDPSKDQVPVELAGFELPSAVRQWGYVGVKVRDDWQILWDEWKNVRQAENLPESLPRDELTVGFEYFSQPFSLPARVVPRATQTRVQPQYVVHVGHQRATLEGRLKYSIRGAKVFSFRIAMPGWKEVEVGPEDIVNKDGVVWLDEEILLVPLKRPSTEPHQIEIKATHAVDQVTIQAESDESTDEQVLLLPLPVPEASSVEPTTLVIQPEDNVELNPRPESMIGLQSQHVAPDVVLPSRQQEPFYFRGDAPRMVFAASLLVHPQSITVQVDSRIDISLDGGEVDQQYLYRILNEPVDHLDLIVPRIVAGLGGPEVSFDGKILPAKMLKPAHKEEDSGDRVTMRVVLPPPARIGAIRLTVRFRLQRDPLKPSRTVRWPVPLVMPGDGQVTDNRIHIESDNSIHVALNETNKSPDWAAVVESNVDETGTADRRLHFEAAERVFEAPLSLEIGQVRAGGATYIEGMWIQSWFTETARQDRVAFRIHSDEPALRVLLPEGIQPQNVEVRLDGGLHASRHDGQGHLLVELPPGRGLRDHRVELRYQFSGRPSRATFAVQSPKLVSGSWMGRAFWQLVLPEREHVLSFGPNQLSAQYRWSWQGLFFARQAIYDQAFLEKFSGAIKKPPHSRSNTYLFSTIEAPSELVLRTADRSMIVLVVSGVALVVLLALIYIPAFTRPGVLVAALVSLLLWGLSYPEIAMLGGQAAVLGIVVAMVAAAMRRLLLRRRTPRRAVGSSSMIIRPEYQEDYLTRGDPGSSAATTIALAPSESNG